MDRSQNYLKSQVFKYWMLLEKWKKKKKKGLIGVEDKDFKVESGRIEGSIIHKE